MKEYFIAFQYISDNGDLMAGSNVIDSYISASETIERYIEEKCKLHDWDKSRMTITAFNAV